MRKKFSHKKKKKAIRKQEEKEMKYGLQIDEDIGKEFEDDIRKIKLSNPRAVTKRKDHMPSDMLHGMEKVRYASSGPVETYKVDANGKKLPFTKDLSHLTMGERIKHLLNERGLAQSYLADAAGISEASVSKYIKGDHTPRDRVVMRVAEVLKVPVDYLQTGKGTAMPEIDPKVIAPVITEEKEMLEKLEVKNLDYRPLIKDGKIDLPYLTKCMLSLYYDYVPLTNRERMAVEEAIKGASK